MQRHLTATALALALAAAPTAGALAADALGSRAVNHNSELDVIAVPGRAKYGQLRLCVQTAAVQFTDLDVFFKNGGHQDVAVRRVVAAGDCTRWIKLAGLPRRNIERIAYHYATFAATGPRAVVRAEAR